jgi:phage terminase large subunit GpA-like protein
LQVFLNTKLALPFQENYQAMKPESLIARRELYDTESLPDDILLLTAGIDCQQDRVEIQVLGFGLGEETWYVNYEVIYGDITRMDIWREVDAFRTTPYRTTSGRKLFIQACCVDTGGIAGSLAFECSKAVRKQRVFPVRGSPQGVHQIWPKIQGRHVPKEHKVFTVSVDACKEILYGRIKVTRPGPGCLHFSMDCDEEYFEQLQSEFQRIRKDRFGRAHPEWVLPSGKRNEVLDCWNYAYCALKSFPANVLQSLAEQRKAATAVAPPPPAPPSDDYDQPEERKDQTAEPWLPKTGWFEERRVDGDLIQPGSPKLVTPGPQLRASLKLPACSCQPPSANQSGRDCTQDARC